MTAPFWRAPFASAMVVSVGLVWPSHGIQTPPARSSTLRLGLRAFTSEGVRSSASTPVIAPIAGTRLSSSRRSRVWASESPPVRRYPVACPVSASRVGNSLHASMVSRVSRIEGRNEPTTPAACQVVPEVRVLRSITTTSRTPSLPR